MNKNFVFAAAAAVVFFSNGNASATGKYPVAISKGMAHPFAHSPADRSLQVLYDQNDDDSGLGVVSQNFEADFATYDDQDADDFAVPDATKWKISEVDVTGIYFDGHGPAKTHNIFFYKLTKKGFPAKKPVAEYDNVKGKGDGIGSFVFTLPKKLTLRAGAYMISVQANMSFSEGGEWAWENRNTQVGAPAAFRNPGDGLGTGCKKWSVEDTCFQEGQGPDHMFTLRGKSLALK